MIILPVTTERPNFRSVEPQNEPMPTSSQKVHTVLYALIMYINTGYQMEGTFGAGDAAKMIIGYTDDQQPNEFELMDRLKTMLSNIMMVDKAFETQLNYHLN